MRKFLLMAGLMLAAGPALAGEAITPAEAQAKLRASGTTLVDVRTPQEWAETGVAPGARAIMMQDPQFVAKVLDSVGGDKTKPVTLICRSGRRSATAMAMLEGAGFTRVDHVGSGMNGWMAAGLPVKK